MYTYDLYALLTPLNGSSISVIIGITTPSSLHNIDQNYSSVKKVLNFNHQKNSLITLLILKVQTECQLLTKINWKMLLLNPHQHVNVLLLKLFYQIVILPVHQFIITPLMITLAIPHKKYIYYQFTTSRKSMQ